MSDTRERRVILVAALLVGLVAVGGVAYASSHLTNSVPIDGTSEPVAIGAPNGMDILITGTADVNTSNPWVANNQVNLTTSKGSADFTGGSGVRATINADEITGTWTNVTALTLPSSLTISPADKPDATVSAGADSLSLRTGMAPDDDTVDFTYSASSSTDLTLNGLPGSTQMAAVDTATQDVLAVDSTDASGQVTFTGLDSGSHTVQLYTSKGEPIIASTSPADNTDLSQSQATLEAEIKDPDFPNGDNVTVEFYLDGNLEDTQHIKSNQTVSTTVQVNTGGDHTWHVETEDAYGQTNDSATFTISTPSQLSIRLETDPDTYAKNVNVQVTAYYSGNVTRRNVTDGNMSLVGFPIDEPIIVRMNATNYTIRTAVIESIFEQQSAYLLNDTVPTYLVRFGLRDPAGTYPTQDSVLFIERDLNQSGSTEWRIIAGDNFGVQGVSARLKQDERYRLRIKNLETGEATVIGAYTAIQSETVTIEPGSGTFEMPNATQEYGWSFVENESGQYILFQYNDTADQTDEIKLTIHERFNESNVLIDNDTFTNTNNLVYQIPMTADQANKTWTARLYIDRGSGFEAYRIPISGGAMNILPGILSSVWITSVGVFIVLIVGMAFSQLNQGVGAITTALTGGMLWWLGILEGVTTGAAIVLAIAVSVVFHYKSGGGL